MSSSHFGFAVSLNRWADCFITTLSTDSSFTLSCFLPPHENIVVPANKTKVDRPKEYFFILFFYFKGLLYYPFVNDKYKTY